MIKCLSEKPIVLVFLSALFLSMPWLSILSPFAFVGFVPILILWKRNVKHFLLWVMFALLLWMSFSCWWVTIATAAAFVGIPLFGLIYNWLPFVIWYKIQKWASEPIRWILFISLYLIGEGLYTYAEFSFPWLTLGNAFARTPILVQWYEWTGVFGGSMWVLLVNVLVFKFITERKCRASLIATIAIPVVCSICLYFAYSSDGQQKSFAVIQPNLNPYTDKYGNMSVHQQLDVILDEASKCKNKKVDYFIAPETAIDVNIWTDRLADDPYVCKVRSFIRSCQLSPVMVIGATTVSKVSPSLSYDYATRKIGDIYYMMFNSSLWIDSTRNVDYYHKGCLVVGAEKLPYPKFFRSIERATGIPFGGIFGNYGRSKRRDVYHGVGTAICYESIYSEYFTEYIHSGAKIMTVITNDGWWNDTPGHVQHMNFSRLRAIETRRAIARSANTGISCLINGRGDVIDSLGWDKKGVLFGTLQEDDRQTLYVRLGDWPIRISWYMLALSLMFMIARTYAPN